MKGNPMRGALFAAAALAATLVALPQVTRAEDVDFAALLAEKSPAIVTVKCVLKMKSRSGESESERETAAVVIGPDGLLLCSDSRLGGGTATPTDIKVLIGDDTEGLDAQVIARDSELDLTWMRISALGERQLAFISVKQPVDAEVGQPIYAVSRLGAQFGRAAVVRRARIGGITAKPRRLLIPTGGGGSLGLPVFNAAGEVVGVTVRQVRDTGESQGIRAVSGAPLILPGDEVRKATARALELAAEEEEADEGE